MGRRLCFGACKMRFGFVFLSLRGRIARRTFWLAMLGLLLAYAAVFLPLLLVWPDDTLASPSALWVRQVIFASDLALAWPSFAVTAKRQQDRGQWPWMAWLMLALTLAYSVSELAGLTETAAGLTIVGGTLLGAIGLASLIILIELGFRRGTDGPNRFGPDPLAGAPAA